MISDGSNFHAIRIFRYLPIIIQAIFILPALHGQVATITASSPLNEAELNSQSITIDLTDGESFIDLVLPADSFFLTGEPPGTDIEFVVGNTLNNAVVHLRFNGTDFDTDYNIGIEISAGELTLTSSDVLASSNTLPVDAYVERVAVVPNAPLNELTMDAAYLDITLTEEEFTSTGSIPSTHFSFNHEPAGLTIESVTASDATHARMQLEYPPGSDFDSPVTNFSVNVSGAILRYTSLAEILTSNELTITAYNETPQASLSIDSTVLEERWLDVRTLTIDLVEERFRDYTTLQIQDFDLVGGPPGLDIGSITSTSAISVDLHLQFDYIDFDGNFPNFRVSIDQLVLVQSGADLVSDVEPVIANIESATLAPMTLREDNLDGQILTVTLLNEVFVTPGSVDENDFVLVNRPVGLEIVSASAISATQAQLTLHYTGTDFDTDITNFAAGISPAALRYTSSGNLITGPITIHAVAEHPVAHLTSDDVLTETNLDIRELTIMLDQEEFDPAVTIDSSRFQLENAPPGLTIESAYRLSPDAARILLQFDYHDFDEDITDFYVEIQSSALIQTTSGWLATDSLMIQAAIEHPAAILSADSALTEERLGFRTLYIELEDENFVNWAGLQTHHFELENHPSGLSIQSVTGTTPTSATIALDFSETDFDTNYAEFHVLIDSLVLVQSRQDLATSTLTIQASVEPFITDISIPDDTMKIGDTVRVTISVESDQGNLFSLNSGEIGGYTLFGPLRRDNDTTYISGFGVEEPGNDYAAYESIPVNGVQLYNGLIPGNIYTRNIIQPNDLLDANKPEFIYIIDNTPGEQDIGSLITLRIHTDEAIYTFDTTSHVNYVRFTSPAIQINPYDIGYYDLYYTVEEGDPDVSEGNLELELTAIDIAGNRSDPYTTIEPNDLSIDASRPVIERAYISSTDTLVIAGDSLDITVEADQPFYRNNIETWINDIPVGPRVTFHELGLGNYRFRYTVQENDQAVPPGSLEVNIVLQDRDPYDNVSITFTDLDSNNVSIRPGKPSAIVSGDTAICYGDSTMIYIRLAGAPPLEFDLTDGTDTVTYENYAQGMHTFWVHPTRKTFYYVTGVVDHNGSRNVGTDSAWITVHPYLDVRIRNLGSSYALSAPMVILDYIPTGGEFEGNGVSPTTPWTFTPSLAGVENSPHEIIYTYTDSTTTCSNADTVVVEVIDAPGDILFEKPVACFNDSVFHITGYNDGDSPGSFSIVQEPATGGFIDLGNDTAILRPGLINFDSTADVYIKYTFTDAGGEVRNIMDTLTIEMLETAQIAPIEDIFCQRNHPVELIGYPAGGKFSGTDGVIGSVMDGFQFDPLKAVLGTNLIRYTYTSDNNCSVQDSGQVIVYFSPVPRFTFNESCILAEGGQIQFQNLTDTGDLVVKSWNWNFKWPSNDEENHSDSQDPYHYFEELGTYEVALEVQLENGCLDSIHQILDLSAYPTAGFTWNSTCYKQDEPILFEGWEDIHGPDTISSRMWRVYDSDEAEIFSDTNRLMYCDSLSEGTFRVSYRVTTAAGCTDSLVRSITLSPVYNLSEDPYYENFEDTLHGWTSMTENPQERNSWTYGRVDTTHFPWNAATGTRAWYTSLPVSEEIEQSWVLSPCFNFMGLDRPMVSLDIKRSLDFKNDGVVLQYQSEEGEDWFNVGKRNDGGLNWYNSDGISDGPGGQNTGWTGEQVFSEDDRWYHAAHVLDELSRYKEVRFRIAYASNGGSTTPNDGFAFDNFTIRQRSRFSVLEYFTNANIAACSEQDSMISSLIESVPADVIDIHYHYHAFGDMPDSFYLENPVPGNSRGTYYGVSKIPMAILDGGGGPFEEVLGHPLVYDFSPSNSPTVEDIRRRSLTEPEFKLTVDINEYTPELTGSIQVEALSDVTRKDLTLHTIILERMVVDEKYEGTNGTTAFYQVARKMDPDARGRILKSSWKSGDISIIPLEYQEDFFPLNEDNIAVVVYIQDYPSLEILQAATKPEYDPGTAIVQVQTQERALLYPNPAGELVNVYLETVPKGSMQFSLFDLSGKRVMADVMQPWQQLYTRSLAGLERGLYIVEIRDTDNNVVVFRGKLLHY